MITIFAVPKPFRGHIAVIQRNAISSWTRLHPQCQVILLGDEEGTSTVAEDLGVLHIPEVARNEYGTPLLSDVISQAERRAKHRLLCYVNCDIILMSDFTRAIERVARMKSDFLMIGQCWDVPITGLLAFDQLEREKHLSSLVKQFGETRGPSAIDYFVFPVGFYEGLPPFALGRACFDLWMIWKARESGAAVVDATRAVRAVHQNHDYSHVPGGKHEAYRGEEATRNWELAGGEDHLYNMSNATHRLTTTGLSWNWAGRFLSKPSQDKLRDRWWQVLTLTRPIRHRLGLRLDALKRFKA